MVAADSELKVSKKSAATTTTTTVSPDAFAMKAAAATATVRPIHDDEEEASRLCNKWVDNGLRQNKAIQFLLTHLEELGCVPPDHFIRCIQCDKPGAGFFGMVQEEEVHVLDDKPGSAANNWRRRGYRQAPKCSNNDTGTLREMLQRQVDGASKLTVKPEVYLCQQYLESELMAHKTIVHELVHAVDKCRTDMDPLHNCLHIACTGTYRILSYSVQWVVGGGFLVADEVLTFFHSIACLPLSIPLYAEIRAENLSGECSFFKELPRMNKFAGHGKE